ncbi:hypothetical protein KBD59_04190 [Candidatus Gracilibacteria bacterium]|nr:hypothetical protein [Candidatus Gracilibacteria bacterium]
MGLKEWSQTTVAATLIATGGCSDKPATPHDVSGKIEDCTRAIDSARTALIGVNQVLIVEEQRGITEVSNDIGRRFVDAMMSTVPAISLNCSRPEVAQTQPIRSAMGTFNKLADEVEARLNRLHPDINLGLGQ